LDDYYIKGLKGTRSMGRKEGRNPGVRLLENQESAPTAWLGRGRGGRGGQICQEKKGLKVLSAHRQVGSGTDDLTEERKAQ